METEKKSFIEKYKSFFIIIGVLVLVFLVLANYENSKTDNSKNYIEQFQLKELKDQMDDLNKNTNELKNTVSTINLKIDSTNLKIDKTKSNITNIYKTTIDEKDLLNKSSDSANLNFFHAYVNDWISTNSNTTDKN